MGVSNRADSELKEDRDNIRDDCSVLDLSLPDADRLARVRKTWKSLVCNMGDSA